MPHTNKYVLITGATAGIGYELAKLFAADKYNLVLVARSMAELSRVAQEFRPLGIEVITIAKDLFKKEEALELCYEVSNSGIEVEILVNDAGQGVFGLFQDNDLERELDIIDLNIGAVVILTKHFLREMLKRDSGKILNLASVAGVLPGPWHAVYHATKAFILSFSESLHSELKYSNIDVTALLPGATDTDFFEKADMQSSKVVQDRNKLANPADVAKDGYEALMAGKSKVVSGFKNKVQIAVSNLIPDQLLAEQVKNMQKPLEE